MGPFLRYLCPFCPRSGTQVSLCRDVDAWFAELGRQMHTVYRKNHLTPDQMRRRRLAAVEKRLAAYRIRLCRE